MVKSNKLSSLRAQQFNTKYNTAKYKVIKKARPKKERALK
jgi:hypothetical protein